MEIDIINNNIIINDSDFNLNSIQISQINFWGFKKQNKSNIYYRYIQDNDNVLTKLLSYFDRESIRYDLSGECKGLVSEVHKSINMFESLRTIGKEYKDGIYNNDFFLEFLSNVRKFVPRKLKDHQIKAAYHLYLVKNGANFSVPGSGKSAVVLSIYEILRQFGIVNLLFIVGPTSSFAPWRKEFSLTLGRDASYCILAGGRKDLILPRFNGHIINVI